MAIFLIRARYGSSYSPPRATGRMFADVSCDTFGADWIEQLARLGVTRGCGDGNYCPNATVNRSSMAVMLLRTLEGGSYLPPPASGVFDDVPAGDPFAPWIEELALRQITSGCDSAGAPTPNPALPWRAP